jgi:flavorubredoxin
VPIREIHNQSSRKTLILFDSNRFIIHLEFENKESRQMSEIERIKCGNGNAYIVSEGEHSILVDTCHEEYRDTPKGILP